MTLFDVVVVVFVLTVLFVVLWPAMNPPHHNATACTNNQKQIGIAFRIWAGDNIDKYPMGVSVTNGGAMEVVRRGNPLLVFQVMSNELCVPILLVCPQDKGRHAATNFNPLTSGNVSYFVNVDSTGANPQNIMSGDDNFEIGGMPVKSGLLEISSNTLVAWSVRRHKFKENYVTMADGSIQEMSSYMLKD